MSLFLVRQAQRRSPKHWCALCGFFTLTSSCVYPYLGPAEKEATGGRSGAHAGYTNQASASAADSNGRFSTGVDGDASAQGGQIAAASAIGVAGATTSAGEGIASLHGGGGTLGGAGHPITGGNANTSPALAQAGAGNAGAATTGGIGTSGGGPPIMAGVANQGGAGGTASATTNTRATGNTGPTGGTSTMDTRVVAITANFIHTCALQATGTVQCWGENSYGGLGYTTTTTCEDKSAVRPCSTLSSSVTGLSNAVMIAAGAEHTCAIVESGNVHRVQCWGFNEFGQLGNRQTSLEPVVDLVIVDGISTAYTLAAGARHSCAVMTDGNTQCWGGNSYGQLGNGVYGDGAGGMGIPQPVDVPGVKAGDVAAGAFHTCAALTTNGPGKVACWGKNECGQLGISRNTPNSATPVLVPGIDTAVRVAAGMTHSCALLSNNTVKCWGCNGGGQLGDGTQTDAYMPVTAKLSEFDGAVAIAAGAYGSTCAVLVSGKVQCWGFKMVGNYNATPTPTMSMIPTDVEGVADAIGIACGTYHTCALIDSGRIQCWGDNSYGELGNGTTDVVAGPSYVTGF